MAPPKAKAEPASTGPMIEQFQALGLSKAKASEAAKNPKSAGILKVLIEDPVYNLAGRTLSEKEAVLISAFASQLAKTDLGETERRYVVGAVEAGRLKSTDQITGEHCECKCFQSMCLTADEVVAATKYLEAHPAPIDDILFDHECGVGASFSPRQWFSCSETTQSFPSAPKRCLRLHQNTLRQARKPLLDGIILARPFRV
jgi:glutaminyl-tRNA synthetase